MKSHELAKQLLALPDLECYTYLDYDISISSLTGASMMSRDFINQDGKQDKENVIVVD